METNKEWLILDSNANIENFISVGFPDELGISPSEWIEHELGKYADLGGLIVPFPTSSAERIKRIELSLHVRLSPHNLNDRSLVPIVFLTDDESNLNDIAKSIGPHTNFLLTEGVYFFSDFEELQKNYEKLDGLEFKAKTYNDFLDSIYIDRSDYIGNHSIANKWGAYRMAEAANINYSNLPNATLESLDSLYFNFLRARNYDLFRKKYVNRSQ
ncbi:MAG: hypothetical protein U5K72_16025 [Balneolaceae bacterium]|nr:hypothetical protein [Balneolaceae bacterium]